MTIFLDGVKRVYTAKELLDALKNKINQAIPHTLVVGRIGVFGTNNFIQ